MKIEFVRGRGARPNNHYIRLTETYLRAVPIVKRVGVEAYRRCVSLLQEVRLAMGIGRSVSALN